MEIDCIYGPPLSGKTSQIIEHIKRFCKTSAKTARVYVGDGSLANYLDSGLIEDGFLEVLDFSGRREPMSVMEMITEGYWSEDPLNPNSKLIETTPEKFNSIGLWIFEGLSVGGDYVLGNVEGGLSWRAARGEKIGQDSPISIKDKESGRAFGGNPMSHYNVAQRLMSGCIQRSKRLPGKKIWTAHERAAEDKLQGELVVGPAVAGGALTATLSRDFNHTLHTTKAVTKTSKEVDKETGNRITVEETEYRLYTQDHYDPDGKFPTKYRAGIRTMRPDLIKPYYVSPVKDIGKGLRDFYNDLEKAREAYKNGK